MPGAATSRVTDAFRAALYLGALAALAVGVYSLLFLLLVVSGTNLAGFAQAYGRLCVRRSALVILSASTLLGPLRAARRRVMQSAAAAGALEDHARQRAVPVPPALGWILVREGVAGDVLLYQDSTAQAFVAGLWRPRIYMSTALVEKLSPCELIAVLRHERYHLRRRDPLRYLVAGALCRSVAFLPLANELLRSFVIATELSADRSALQDGDCMDLASALVKVARGRTPGDPVAAAAGVTGAFEIRLARLLGKEVKDYGIRAHSVTQTGGVLCFLGCLVLGLCQGLPSRTPM